jgi:hypothetical protein
MYHQILFFISTHGILTRYVILCFLDVDADNPNICEHPKDGGTNTPDDDPGLAPPG